MIENHKAAVHLLTNKEAFDTMVCAAEDAHETGASFNVVIGEALRSLVQAPTPKENFT